MPFDFSLESLAKAGILSVISSLVAGVFWMLAQKEVIGLRTLRPGDRGFRTLFGRPMWYMKRCWSHFFIKDVFDVHVVSTFTLVHNPVEWTYGEGNDKIKLYAWIETKVKDNKKDVWRAIFALGESFDARHQANKRTVRAEGAVRSELGVQSVSPEGHSKHWRDLDLDKVMKLASLKMSENGTVVTGVRLTDPNVSDSAIVAKAIDRATEAVGANLPNLPGAIRRNN